MKQHSHFNHNNSVLIPSLETKPTTTLKPIDEKVRSPKLNAGFNHKKPLTLNTT